MLCQKNLEKPFLEFNKCQNALDFDKFLDNYGKKGVKMLQKTFGGDVDIKVITNVMAKLNLFCRNKEVAEKFGLLYRSAETWLHKHALKVAKHTD